jgi:carboxypeptidase C (cathepsin A)
MLAFAQEHGPFVMEDESNVFVENPYSWNREANMLYLESPAGVGYSYYESDSEKAFDDKTSSTDNLLAILEFYKKFPELKNNDFYISGESYGGIYVPYAAWRVDQWNSD